MSIRITDCFYLFKSWHHYNRCCAGWKIWEGTDCQGVVAIVSGALLLILEGVYRYKRRGNTGAIAGDAGSAARRALGMDIVGKMESALRARGVQFESISVPALAARNADGVSSTTISMLGVRDLETGAATDHLLALRDDGTGTMTVRNTPQDKLSRRHDGPGLKVNWLVLQNDGNDIDLTTAKLVVTDGIGQQNDNTAKHGGSDLPMSEYLGSYESRRREGGRLPYHPRE